MPLYNKAPYVARALASVVAQTFPDFEVIVVDDGSTDRSAEIVGEFPNPRVHLIRQRNLGPGAARNRGIQEAHGDLVAFLDADDEWLPGYLSESVRLLDEAGARVASVTCGYLTEPGGKSQEQAWRRRGLSDGVHSVGPQSAPALVVSMLAYLSPCTTVVRASVLRRWGGFYSRDRCLYAEDAHLWLKVLLNEPVAFTLKPLARLHLDAAGLSHNLPGPRPIEPFLVHPEEIEAACPPHLDRLLARILASRAFKTACVLGYWGHWREAGELIRRFEKPGAWRLPYYVPSLVCRTRIGAILGRMSRMIGSARS